MSAIQFNMCASKFNEFLSSHKNDITRMDYNDYTEYSEGAFEDKYKVFYKGGINDNYGHYYVFTRKAEEWDETKPY